MHATAARQLRGECQLRRAGGQHQEGAQEAATLSQEQIDAAGGDASADRAADAGAAQAVAITT